MRAMSACLLLMLAACSRQAPEALPPPPPPPPSTMPTSPPPPEPATTGSRPVESGDRDAPDEGSGAVWNGPSDVPRAAAISGVGSSGSGTNSPARMSTGNPRGTVASVRSSEFVARPAAMAPLSAAGSAPETLASIRAWTTASGTLAPRALSALLAECEGLGLSPADCSAEIIAAAPPFDRMPADARAEAVLLLQACRGMPAGANCAAMIRRKRELRDLPIGLLRPEPRTMREGEETTFTAFIRRTAVAHRPGDELPPPAADGAAPTGEGGVPAEGALVEYSQQMCFLLEASPRDFRIADRPEQCPPYQSGGAVAFAPSWQVTPLREGTLALRLTRILRLGQDEERYKQQPYPVMIEVIPAPGAAARVTAWLTDWTGVAKAGSEFADALRALVIAIEALILAILGLSVWKLLRRRGAPAGTGPPPAPPAST